MENTHVVERVARRGNPALNLIDCWTSIFGENLERKNDEDIIEVILVDQNFYSIRKALGNQDAPIWWNL